jgi:hypothetical protein
VHFVVETKKRTTFCFASRSIPISIITEIEKIGIPTGKMKMHAMAHILVKEKAEGQGILTSENWPELDRNIRTATSAINDKTCC